MLSHRPVTRQLLKRSQATGSKVLQKPTAVAVRKNAAPDTSQSSSSSKECSLSKCDEGTHECISAPSLL